LSRFFIFLLTAFLLTLLESTLVSLIFPSYLKPDLMILLVIFLGISFPLLPGALLIFLCGLLYDTFSGGPFGLFAFVYLCIFFSLKVVAKILILGETLVFRVILVAVLMSLQSLLLMFLPLSLGIATHLAWPPSIWILPQMLITCAAVWPLFHLLRRVDIPPAEESLPPVP
jgi:rod shape-determining protein MreD